MALVPRIVRKRTAERMLSLSPHYFYGKHIWLSRKEIEDEVRRNDESRRKIMDDVLAPYLRHEMTVLDYGCGPGFLSKHVGQRVARVYAVDISDGVLECAKEINSGSGSIEYGNIRTGVPGTKCQLAYSFAVFQHLTRDVAKCAAEYIYQSLESGGIAVVHVVLDTAEGWKPEGEAIDFALKMKRIYGLNCFSRKAEELVNLFASCGFSNIEIIPVCEVSDVSDDIQRQHILFAHKPL